MLGPSATAEFFTGEFQGEPFVMADPDTIQFPPALVLLTSVLFEKKKKICASPLVRKLVLFYSAGITTKQDNEGRVPILQRS